MKFIQHRAMALSLAFGVLCGIGCTENGADLTKGELPPDAPKSSEEAYKKLGNMAPQGAPKSGRPKMTPPRPPSP